MLPSRGLSRSNPASALRFSISGRTQPARPLTQPTFSRQFSQGPSSSAYSGQALGRSFQVRNGSQLPRLASIGSTGSLGVASSVFAQRAGASRSLSLWPFGSKSQPASPETQSASAASSPESWTPVTESQTSGVTAGNNVSASASASDSAASHVSSSPPPNPVDLSSGSSAHDSFSDLDLTSVLDIPEQIGYLKNLGLDYGVGPTAMVEWALEHLYIYSGMPWWATIATLGVGFRLAMLYPALTATKHQVIMQKVQSTPEYQQAKQQYNDAAWRTQDRAAMLSASTAMRNITKQSGASMLRPFVNMLTVPFSYGMFRLFRAMAAIPVPSLETGGIAWFTDLTVHDPYYILPCISVGLGVMMMKQIQASNYRVDAQQQAMSKGMLYLLPPLIFLGTAWLPAGIQWFFLILSAGSTFQTTLSMSPAIRRWADIPPLPQKPSDPVAIGKAAASWQAPKPRGAAGFVGGIKKDVGELSKGVKSTFGVDDKKALYKKANEYEERRASEEREKEYRRMEDLRRKRAERERRR